MDKSRMYWKPVIYLLLFMSSWSFAANGNLTLVNKTELTLISFEVEWEGKMRKTEIRSHPQPIYLHPNEALKISFKCNPSAPVSYQASFRHHDDTINSIISSAQLCDLNEYQLSNYQP